MRRQFRLAHVLLALLTGWAAGTGLLWQLLVLGAGVGGLALLAAAGMAVVGGRGAVATMGSGARAALVAGRPLLGRLDESDLGGTAEGPTRRPWPRGARE
jgi:hypothetical protein